MANDQEKIADFHVRLGRLEEIVLKNFSSKKDSKTEDLAEIVLAALAATLCYFGFGLPNHYYQLLFSIVILISLYHKGIFPYPSIWYDWLLLIVNCFIISMLLKLIIGGGDPRPLSWLAYPTLEGGITSFKLSWQTSSIASWQLPLTLFQSFFLMISLFGAFIGFTLLSSLTSFILIILALPSLVSFNWDFALPGMMAALTTFYLQKE